MPRTFQALRDDLSPAWVGPEFLLTRRKHLRFDEYRWPHLKREAAERLQSLLFPALLGRPCPGHPDRCQAQNRFRGQCSQWRDSGSKLCAFHLKKRQPGFSKLVNPYTRRMASTMIKLIDEANAETEDIMDTSSEIEVLRGVVMRCGEQYSRAIDPDNRKRLIANGMSLADVIKLETHAREDLSDAISNVNEAVHKLAKTVALRKDAFNPTLLAAIWIKQQQILQESLTDHPEILQDIEGRFSTVVKPMIEDGGQTIVVE